MNISLNEKNALLMSVITKLPSPTKAALKDLGAVRLEAYQGYADPLQSLSYCVYRTRWDEKRFGLPDLNISDLQQEKMAIQGKTCHFVAYWLFYDIRYPIIRLSDSKPAVRAIPQQREQSLFCSCHSQIQETSSHRSGRMGFLLRSSLSTQNQYAHEGGRRC